MFEVLALPGLIKSPINDRCLTPLMKDGMWCHGCHLQPCEHQGALQDSPALRRLLDLTLRKAAKHKAVFQLWHMQLSWLQNLLRSRIGQACGENATDNRAAEVAVIEQHSGIDLATFY